MNPISDILSNPRVVIRDGFTPDDDGGCFFYRFGGKRLFVIVSWGDGWEHASVSVGGDPNVIPTWDDMSAVHRLVWGDEPAMQLHVSRSDHVNYHPGVLHLWRPTNGAEIPLPPSWMVGPGKKVRDKRDAANADGAETNERHTRAILDIICGPMEVE